MEEEQLVTPRESEADARIAIDDRLRAAGWDPADKSQIRTEVLADATSRLGLADRSQARPFVPVLARFQYGQTKPGLGFRELLTSKIPVPPISLQRAFAGHVESLRDLGRRRRRARGRLRVLWQSVLTSAFSGNLTQRWREAHMNELLREMDQQAMTLGEIR